MQLLSATNTLPTQSENHTYQAAYFIECQIKGGLSAVQKIVMYI
jgi:hypothetical protein